METEKRLSYKDAVKSIWRDRAFISPFYSAQILLTGGLTAFRLWELGYTTSMIFGVNAPKSEEELREKLRKTSFSFEEFEEYTRTNFVTHRWPWEDVSHRWPRDKK